MKKILSTNEGHVQISEEMRKKLNVKPLIHQGKVVKNQLGEVVMDDQFIYTYVKNYGNVAINLNRAKYCQKMYLSETTIQESIGNKLMDYDLKLFVEKVSDRLVFEKFGKWYKVELYKKTNRTYGLKKVQLYKWFNEPNRKFDGIFAYNLSLDWKSVFYV